MKLGICSEIFKDWNDVGRAIDYAKEVGYDGIEIAPFTLSQYVTDIPQETRDLIVNRAAAAGLEIAGIHWILVGPDGLHLNGPDEEARERTIQYLIDLAHFCGDIGGKVAIFGSPKQRNVLEGVNYDQAFQWAAQAFERALPTYEERGVTLCMEPLTHQETNFCQSAAETFTLVERVDHPNFKMMLDTKAMTFEEDDRATLIRRYAGAMAHYHANDENLNGPGWGDVDFGPIFEALKDVDYQGYVSVEVFKFEPGPEAIAAKSLEYMKQFV